MVLILLTTNGVDSPCMHDIRHAERERRRAEAASRQAEQLRGHLATLRRQLHSAPSAAAGGRAALRPGTAPEPSFDQSGRVPWHPPGAVPLPAVGRLSAEVGLRALIQCRGVLLRHPHVRTGA